MWSSSRQLYAFCCFNMAHNMHQNYRIAVKYTLLQLAMAHKRDAWEAVEHAILETRNGATAWNFFKKLDKQFFAHPHPPAPC